MSCLWPWVPGLVSLYSVVVWGLLCASSSIFIATLMYYYPIVIRQPLDISSFLLIWYRAVTTAATLYVLLSPRPSIWCNLGQTLSLLLCNISNMPSCIRVLVILNLRLFGFMYSQVFAFSDLLPSVIWDLLPLVVASSQFCKLTGALNSSPIPLSDMTLAEETASTGFALPC